MQSCSFALASKATTLKANARGTEQSVFIVTVGHGAHLSNGLETQSGSVLITWSSCSWNKWRKLCDAAWWHVVLALCSDAGCHGGVGGGGVRGRPAEMQIRWNMGNCRTNYREETRPRIPLIPIPLPSPTALPLPPQETGSPVTLQKHKWLNMGWWV